MTPEQKAAFATAQAAALDAAPCIVPGQRFFELEVRKVLSDLGDLLIAKNRKYGDSALSPKRVFSKASPVEQLCVRLDDKISRLSNQQPDEDEDAEWDLMGYLVLLRIAKLRAKSGEPDKMISPALTGNDWK